MSNTGFFTTTLWIEQLLRQAPALALDIERSREKRVEPTVDSALRIYPENADGQAAAVRGGFHRFAFDVTVDCYARAPVEGTDAGDVEKAADTLLQAVLQRLATAAAPAGVSSLLERPRMAWNFIEADRPLGCIRLTFGVGLATHNQTFASWS
jgi:hypothetical protein